MIYFFLQLKKTSNEKKKRMKIVPLQSMKKWLIIFFGVLFLGLNSLEAKTTFLDVSVEVAAKEGTKLLNQFNSAKSLISGAGKLSPIKGGFQGFVKGDGASIFKALTQGGKPLPNGRFLLSDGTNIGKHFSSNTGAFTINMNRGGQLYKIRITP